MIQVKTNDGTLINVKDFQQSLRDFPQRYRAEMSDDGSPYLFGSCVHATQKGLSITGNGTCQFPLKVDVKLFFVTYLYTAPSDVTPKGQRPLVQVNSGIFTSLEDAISFVREHFDGLETWDEYFTPQIKEHFENHTGDFLADDYTAGQWAKFSIFDGNNITHQL